MFISVGSKNNALAKLIANICETYDKKISITFIPWLRWDVDECKLVC